ncbi:hypothetical protein HGM15179_010617 [Zosterops borbonicus]|uniref:Uncharacterized protein n=1 Tax=Zosterops borbonicus TaxID=364589 RepID=A0A8K1LK28_9PASS|nr:hypothetical protein HGM15179_010617 [Zosterops borbonicus]
MEQQFECPKPELPNNNFGVTSKEASPSQAVILIRDFNHLDVYWVRNTTGWTQSRRLLDFLIQVLDKSTREVLLDLVLTNANELIKEEASPSQAVILIRDFNHLDVYWVRNTTGWTQSRRLLDFLIQVLDKSTREVLLDLVLTNANELIKEVRNGESLDCSNFVILRNKDLNFGKTKFQLFKDLLDERSPGKLFQQTEELSETLNIHIS